MKGASKSAAQPYDKTFRKSTYLTYLGAWEKPIKSIKGTKITKLGVIVVT
jgi:hypothetical protein